MVTKKTKRKSSHSSLHTLMKNKYALSTVVTTLIILVISVLLASVVTYFAINVVSTRVQEESLALTKQHIWYSSDGTQAALMIINTGGRDVVIQKFAIRGQTVDWTNVYYATTDQAVSADLDCNTAIAEGKVTIGDIELNFVNAQDSLTLRSGYSMILYITTPDSITINDVGLTVSITLNTAQAMYYVEANVQAYIGGAQDSSQGITVSNLHAWYDSSGSSSQVALVLTNTNKDGDPIFIDTNQVSVGNQAVSSSALYAGTSDPVSSPLTYIQNLQDGTVCNSKVMLTTTIAGIDPGQTTILYIKNPSGISASDIGKSVKIEIALQDGHGTITRNIVVQAP